jgi:hypothetical protein
MIDNLTLTALRDEPNRTITDLIWRQSEHHRLLNEFLKRLPLFIKTTYPHFQITSNGKMAEDQETRYLRG